MTKKTFEEIIAEQGKLIYTHVGDSMAPLLMPRDLLVIKPLSRPPQINDIPLYKRDSGQYVLHRVVGIKDGDYITRGDNRSEAEFGVKKLQIIGVLSDIIRGGETVPVAEATKRLLLKTTLDLVYLVSCAVNGEKPSAQRCAEMNLFQVYRMARMHFLTAAAAFALEQVTELPHAFDQAKKKAIRKQALFDIERNNVLREFDKAGIWYLPLKGILLKDCYPKSAMREMNDNDILCDSTKKTEIREIMARFGYTCEIKEEYIHDNYSKPPTLEFEMHSALFCETDDPMLAEYFKDISHRLTADSRQPCLRHMTDEDLYIYLLCHIYKHYSHSGTGLRSLLDIYLFNREYADRINREAVEKELSALGLTEFEQETRELSEKLFTCQTLNDEETEQLILFAESGVNGTPERAEYQHMMRALDGNDSKEAKRKYLLRRVFVPIDSLKKTYPVVYRHKFLYPALIVYRPIKGLFTHPKGILKEFKTVRRFKK